MSELVEAMGTPLPFDHDQGGVVKQMPICLLNRFGEEISASLDGYIQRVGMHCQDTYGLTDSDAYTPDLCDSVRELTDEALEKAREFGATKVLFCQRGAVVSVMSDGDHYRQNRDEIIQIPRTPFAAEKGPFYRPTEIQIHPDLNVLQALHMLP